MKWLAVVDDWERLRVEALARWPRLSYWDLKLVQGERARLCAKLTEHYGFTPDEADEAVTNWQERLSLLPSPVTAD